MAELSEQIREWVAAPRLWHLATVNQDGSPQVSPLWIDVEGDHIVFNTAVGRVKEENLRREPRVSLSCLDTENPYDRVVIHGRVVEFVEGEEAGRCLDLLARKYVGTDRSEWRRPGERRAKVLVEPIRSRQVVGVEPFRQGHRP